MTTAVSIGRRVQRLRLASGLSQADLAGHTGIATGAVSMIENGRHFPDHAALVAIARLLACSLDYLHEPDDDVVSSRPWLRAYADAPKRAVDRYVADTELAVQVFRALQLKTLPDISPSFGGDANDDEQIEDFADAVRRAAHIPDGAVVGNTVRAAERLGCVVLPMDDELGRHLGMSLRVDAFPVIRVARPRINDVGDVVPPGDRQRFTVAHELGHLSLHAASPAPASADEGSLVERQAHRFAGAFLAPAEPLLADLDELGGRVTLTTLKHLKQRWGVSIKMLVVRLRQLGMIDDHHARSLYKQISARGWNKNEPVPVGHEDAIWLERSLAKSYAAPANPATHRFQAAAERAGLDTEYLDRWVDWTASPDRTGQGAHPTSDVVTLTPKAANPGQRTTTGSVTHLASRGRGSRRAPVLSPYS